MLLQRLAEQVLGRVGALDQLDIQSEGQFPDWELGPLWFHIHLMVEYAMRRH
jgi:hypothetical protein